MDRLGVAFAEGLQPGEVVECVKLAEDLGYESAWMAEGHGGAFSILTACAMATGRILLGTSISSVFVRTAPSTRTSSYGARLRPRQSQRYPAVPRAHVRSCSRDWATCTTWRRPSYSTRRNELLGLRVALELWR